jgi:hypothetical protein
MKIKKALPSVISLFLMFAMAFSIIVIPVVNAQALIMNLPGGQGVMHYVYLNQQDYDIDLNGPSEPGIPMQLWVKWPGRADFTLVHNGTTLTVAINGDLDIYTGQVQPDGSAPFNFNETGVFELKWVSPPYGLNSESNVEQVTVVTDASDIPPTVSTIPVYLYVATAPDTIGVGQNVLLYMWTNEVPPDIGEESGAIPSPSGRQSWRQGIYMVVTKPDGTNQTFTIAESDPIGAAYVVFSPEQTGTYHLQGFFPAVWKNDSRSLPPSADLYEYAESISIPFTVTEELRQPWPESPLPTQYFTRPISEAARQWSPLLGDWLQGAANVYPPGSYGGNTQRFVYSKGPESAHILWTKPYYAGGLMSDYYGDIGYQTSHYQGIDFSPVIILEGKIYMTWRDTAHSERGYKCVDLYTGETLYYKDETMPSFGQIYNYDSPNQHGGFAYLWRTSGVQLPDSIRVPNAELIDGQVVRLSSVRRYDTADVRLGTVWEMLDGHTGEHITYIANVSSGGTAVYAKDGSILRYSTTRIGGAYHLRIWNSSAGTMIASQYGTGNWQWRPMGGGFGASNAYLSGVGYDYVHDGNDFWSLDKELSQNLAGYSIRAIREGEYMILVDDGQNDPNGVVEGKVMALSLEYGNEGALLWQSSYTRPYAPTGTSVSMTGVYPEDEVILFDDQDRLTRWGYDMKTGQQLWEGDPEPEFNYYSMQENVYDGKLLTTGYGGVLIAYNMRTGVQEWNFTAQNVGFESPYGNYPMNIFGIADGKIYTLTGEHSITQPMWRGPNMRCINASNGVELWNLLNFGANGGAHLTGMYVVFAEDKVVGINFFDNMIYCVGAGDSGTTVTASPKSSVYGTSVVIEGTVTDQTPTGRRNTNDIVDWTLEGTPAISDEDMGRWMEYLFQQQIFPSEAKGVEVSLDAIDPNNNFVHIDDVTSDVEGVFGLAFVPEVPGTYKIIATFAGSAAYGPSSAHTFITVDEAPVQSPTPTPTPPPASVADQYIVPASIGIIVAIIVVGALIILMLRKR